MSRFDPVWHSLEHAVASRWAPGIVAGIKQGGQTEFFATGVGTFDSPDLVETGTPFRIASLSKPVGGALAVSLIADGIFGPDDPVERWLPELAHPRVLVRPDAPLDQTVPADKPITVRHLLTLTHGLGALFTESPLSAAMQDAGMAPSPVPPRMSPDEYMARIGKLPLAHQPGTRWMYHTGSDILSVLLVRAAGTSLSDLLKKRITDPLGMRSTGFTPNAANLPTAYRPTPDGIAVFDAYDRAFSQPPEFESIGGGLLSTVPDYLTFLSALSDDTLLSPELRQEMTTDQLTSEQRVGITERIGPGKSWGWQISVETARSEPWTAPGRYGWNGGSGTSAFVDSSRDLIGIVFTQRQMAGLNGSFAYFWEPLAAAI